MSDTTDNVYRRGDAITFLLKHKPFIDVSLPPSSQEYRDATCINIAIYGTTPEESLIFSGQMKRVPNRVGWYFYRYQTTRDMFTGLYTVIYTSVTKIDGEDLTSRAVDQFRLYDDGVL